MKCNPGVNRLREYTQEMKTMERRADIDSHAPQADREYSRKEN